VADGHARSIVTERLELRWFATADAALMLGVWNDPAFMRYVGDRGIRTLPEAEAALEAGILAMYREKGYGPYRVAIRERDEPIGICGLFKRDYLDDPDIGFGLLPEYCRSGYAYEASRAVLDDARDGLGLSRVTAIVSPENVASIGLIEKLGMHRVELLRPPGEDKEVLLYAVEFDQQC
jgi:RimJ/RimL family protein N-acetyltransferase